MSSSGRIVANGQELYFEIHGHGPPLVLVMGIGYDSSLWTLHQVPALARGFTVITFDNRDSGRSSRSASGYTIGDMADDVAALLEALEIPRAHVMGLSMGGMIGQEFALNHRSRVDRLVLSGCGAAPARNAFDPIRSWTWVKSRDESGEAFAAEQFTWLFSAGFLRNHEAVRQTIAFLGSNPNPMTAAAYERQARAYLKHDALDRLGDITAPTLVVVGEEDRLTPPQTARELADAIPGSRFEIITGPGSSHALPLERPDDFNRLVTSFLPARSDVQAQAGRLYPSEATLM